MRNTARLCAAMIAKDIGSVPDFCECHGGSPLFDPLLTPVNGAMCVDGEIILPLNLSDDRLLGAITHELVHRLAPSERWEELNYLVRPEWDRLVFLELVARETERIVCGCDGDHGA